MHAVQRQSIYVVLLSVALLSGAGLLMLASTGAYATDGTAEGYAGLKRQSIYLVLAVGACAVAALIDYRVWERFFWPFFLGTLVLLVLCFVPGVGLKINNEWRWISARSVGLPFVRMQPSELGKVAVLFFLAWWYARRPLRVRTFWSGFLAPLLVLAVPIGLIGIEKDLGTAALLAGVVMAVMFVAGVRWPYLVTSALLAGGALAAAIWTIPERMSRILAFLDLEGHRYGEGLQQWRAMIALGSGGVTGRGYGNGIEKMFYMPYAHTDFIFPMIGEEFGLVGSLAVVLAFVLFVVGGMTVAASAPDGFGKLLGAGIVILVGCQAVVNIGVTTAVLPNKGLPLPFISYGGSSLVVLFFLLGILVNLYRQGVSQEGAMRGLLADVPTVCPRL